MPLQRPSPFLLFPTQPHCCPSWCTHCLAPGLGWKSPQGWDRAARQGEASPCACSLQISAPQERLYSTWIG